MESKTVKPIEIRRPLSPEHEDALRMACETPKEKLIIFTLLETGLRVGELCALTDQSILWQQGAMRVNGKGGPFGKMSKLRLVPMSPIVKTMLHAYFSLNKKWFVKKRMAQLIVTNVANRAKLVVPVSAHVLRHTFCCNYLAKGGDTGTLKTIAGHERITTTERYLNFSDYHLIEAFNRVWK